MFLTFFLHPTGPLSALQRLRKFGNWSNIMIAVHFFNQQKKYHQRMFLKAAVKTKVLEVISWYMVQPRLYDDISGSSLSWSRLICCQKSDLFVRIWTRD